MNHNWEYKRLGEVGAIITGSTPKTSIEEYYNSPDVMFVKPGDIFDTGITNISRTQTYVSKLAYQECCRKLPANSILVTCIGIIGKVGILSEDATCNQQINAIIPYGCNHKYLAYAILSIKSTLDAKRNGPVVPIINKSQFSSFQIPVPPMEVQEQIVAELDQIKDLIAKNRELLSQLDNLAHSLFYDFFGDPISNPKGWETQPLSEIAPQYPYSGELSVESDLWLLNLDMIEKNTGRIISHQKVKYEDIGNSVYKICPHQVLYSKLRPNLNKVVIADDFGYCTSELLPLNPIKDLMNCQYLAYLLRSKECVSVFIGKVAGAKMPRTDLKVFRTLQIPVPPLILQEKFAKRIEQIDAQKKAIEETITNLQTLLNSRMDYWFN